MKKFRVPIWWYELHSNVVITEAENKDMAHDLVLDNLGDYVAEAQNKVPYNTFSDTGDIGIDREWIVEED